MDHLKEAKMHAQQARDKGSEYAQVSAQLAIAHVLIALVEQRDKAAKEPVPMPRAPMPRVHVLTT